MLGAWKSDVSGVDRPERLDPLGENLERSGRGAEEFLAVVVLREMRPERSRGWVRIRDQDCGMDRTGSIFVVLNFKFLRQVSPGGNEGAEDREKINLIVFGQSLPEPMCLTIANYIMSEFFFIIINVIVIESLLSFIFCAQRTLFIADNESIGRCRPVLRERGGVGGANGDDDSGDKRAGPDAMMMRSITSRSITSTRRDTGEEPNRLGMVNYTLLCVVWRMTTLWYISTQ